MNKFIQHIPAYCEGFEPESFEFTDFDDLCSKLNADKSSLVYDDGYVMEVNQDETYWWCLGRVKHTVYGLRHWKGAPYRVIEVETIHGWGLDSFEPKTVGEYFNIRGKEIKSYSGFRNGIIGELKDGRKFIGERIKCTNQN